jgi:hypothetical protein
MADELVAGLGCVGLSIILFIISGAMISQTSGSVVNGTTNVATGMANSMGMIFGLGGVLAFIVGIILIFVGFRRGSGS